MRAPAADRVAIHRRIAPPENRQAFLARDPLDNAFAEQALLRFHRQEYHADAVLARLRQREAQARAFAREKLVRNLDQDARAVAGLRIASASAAMREIDQNLDALLMISCDLSPSRFTTKPMPQASCSCSDDIVPALREGNA